MEQVVSQLKSHILDEKYFTARFFAFLSGLTGCSAKHVAFALAFIVAFYLELGPGAFFVANSLLIGYPMVTTYIYPDERPVRDLLLVYWGVFGLLTAFDRFLDFIPLYYNLKVCLLALFFLEPFCLAEKLFNEVKLKEYSLWTSSEQKSIPTCHSPRSEKPAKGSKEATAESISIPDLNEPKKQSKETVSVTTELPKEHYQQLKTAVEEPMAEKFVADVTAILAGHGLTGSRPIMQNFSCRTGTDNKEIELEGILLSPKDALVFNAPFGHENLTYNMKVKNNSKHQIAFAIKGNCIPRITSSPPCGLLTPGETVAVAITARKFEYNVLDFNKDRIVFEYVLLKEEQKKFSHKLLQQADVKRMKYIKILYNP